VFYLDLNVPSTPYGVEPIDSLQVLFDEWLGIHVDVTDPEKEDAFRIYPNPAWEYIVVSRQSLVVSHQSTINSTIRIINSSGQVIKRMHLTD